MTVFVAHASQNRDVAEHLEKFLERRGHFVELDDGAVWVQVDANDPNVIYASLWEAYRRSWQMSSGGPGSGGFSAMQLWTRQTGLSVKYVIGGNSAERISLDAIGAVLDATMSRVRRILVELVRDVPAPASRSVR